MGRILRQVVVAGMIALSVGLEAARAPACSVAAPEAFEPSPSSDTTPPKLESASISIRRAKDPGGSDADCSNLGALTLTFQASDDVSELKKLGISLELVSGNLPFSLPKGAVTDRNGIFDPGTLVLSSGDNGDEYDAVVAVRVLDEAGNSSDEINVHVSGDEVGGCAFSPNSHESRQSSLGIALSLAAVLLSRRLTRTTRLRYK